MKANLLKTFQTLRVKSGVALHYFARMLRGEITPRQYVALLRRLNLFLSKLRHNKFASAAGGRVRLDLYVPDYPSRAFWTAADKFKRFGGERFPCATVLMSVTKACAFKCPHCYQRRDNGPDAPIERLVETARALQEQGVAFFNIEGGEPFLAYERLKTLCAAIDGRSEIWINTTGMGVTAERLRELKPDALMFSLHGATPAELNAFMGRDDAWELMSQGIAACREAGARVAFNSCLAGSDFRDGSFEKLMDVAKNFGASLVQIIKPKPAGAWLGKGGELFGAEDSRVAVAKINDYNLAPRYAEYPAISAQIIEESPPVFGCTAGGTDRFYINAKGDVQPCEFLNISFGNINDETIGAILPRMRAAFAVPGTAMLCEQSAEKIANICAAHSLETLPLPPDLSREVIGNWLPGPPTELYEKAARMK